MTKTIKKAPVVTILGHVDHGKTSILDAIRKTQVQAKEPGGITQHVRVHPIVHEGQPITFVDTPGHKAFVEMRSRGGQVADIAVLVVAADDSVKPQTKEAIEHIKRSGASMIVAINKMDLPGANPDKVRQDLANNGVMLEGWGGDVPVVEVSAVTGKNIDQLLEMILLVADVLELEADPEKKAEGVIMESRLDKSIGAVSTVIIRDGTLKVDDYISCAGISDNVRALLDMDGNNVESAGPSAAVTVLGINEVLPVGAMIFSADSLKEAEGLSAKTSIKEEVSISADGVEVEDEDASLAALFATPGETVDKKSLAVILKTDFAGTLEAIASQLEDLSDEEVQVNLLLKSTGDITEKDIMTAKQARGLVIGFNVAMPDRVAEIARREKVIVRVYNIIYDLIDEIDEVLTSMLEPIEEEIELGKLEVKEKFILSNKTIVAGCVVREGTCAKGHKCYVLRGEERIGDGRISSVRVLKDEVKQVKKGQECGVQIDPQVEVEEGDVIVCYRIERV